MFTHTDGSGGRSSPPFACVSVFQHDVSKTVAARINILDIEMFHDESWKPIYFGVKSSRSRVTKKVAGVDLCTYFVNFVKILNNWKHPVV